jgi:hypothetical protein
VIEGISLAARIEHFEPKRGMEPPGGYGGLVPSFFRFGPLDRYFLGESEDEHFKKKGECYVLACKCGEVGCWPLSALITETDSAVVWDCFAQEHRRERDYSGFGPFAFELRQYKLRIKEASVAFLLR